MMRADIGASELRWEEEEPGIFRLYPFDRSTNVAIVALQEDGRVFWRVSLEGLCFLRSLIKYERVGIGIPDDLLYHGWGKRGLEGYASNGRKARLIAHNLCLEFLSAFDKQLKHVSITDDNHSLPSLSTIVIMLFFLVFAASVLLQIGL